MDKIKIFVSYSHEEEDWILPNGKYRLIPWLQKQLKEDAEIWTDNWLKEHYGDEYSGIIKNRIEQSDIALLLISQDFVSSEYIMDFELPLVKNLYDKKCIKIFPILVSELSEVGKDKISWLFGLQIYPNQVKPLITFYDNTAEWSKIKVGILNGIQKRLNEIKNNPITIMPTKNNRDIVFSTSNHSPNLLTSKHLIFILSTIIIAMSIGLFFTSWKNKQIKLEPMSMLVPSKNQLREEIEKRKNDLTTKIDQVYSFIERKEFDEAKIKIIELLNVDPLNKEFRKLLVYVNMALELENIDSFSSKPIKTNE